MVAPSGSGLPHSASPKAWEPGWPEGSQWLTGRGPTATGGGMGLAMARAAFRRCRCTPPAGSRGALRAVQSGRGVSA